MKKFVALTTLAALSALTLASSASANGWLENSAVELNGVKASNVHVNVVYPGHLSGVCGVEIYAKPFQAQGAPISELLKLVKVTDGQGRVFRTKPSGRFSVLIPLAAGETSSYGVQVRITTLDGSSVDSAVRKAFPENRDVMMLPAICR